ncbi:diphthine--ammonia ligase [Reichenbachiella sp. MALMAid0571]|uniref:Dph6-related ATP pyrophosphatase n=1 Tax=Reichenbachiella sp. MALMAid0571 TaxID=3143939 RepID=UPI0032DEA405
MSLSPYHTGKRSLLCSWSGGKDSCFALMKILEGDYHLSGLLNMTNESGERSRSHGLKPEILAAQAKSLRIPIKFMSSSWQNYESNFINTLKNLKSELTITDVVYGDIDILSHKKWEEKVSYAAGLQAHLPLWQSERTKLVEQMVDSGIKAMIVSCNQTLGATYLGRIIDKDVITEFKKIGVDPCGENGEYHTLVLNCPIFKHEIEVVSGNNLESSNYHFLDLSLKV